MWGNPHPACPGCPIQGPTPTHVGKPPRFVSVGLQFAAHHHACGETHFSVTVTRSAFGPPPRMWGNLIAPYALSEMPRPTPTHVGKPTDWKMQSIGRKAHPHACGETDRPYQLDLLDDGPPPRMWGNQTQRNPCNPTSWHTPTHVGKPLFRK